MIARAGSGSWIRAAVTQTMARVGSVRGGKKCSHACKTFLGILLPNIYCECVCMGSEGDYRSAFRDLYSSCKRFCTGNGKEVSSNPSNANAEPLNTTLKLQFLKKPPRSGHKKT